METDFSLIFGERPRFRATKFYYAYDMVVSGLRHYCGEYAEWLPEYDEIVDWLRDNKGKGLLVIGDTGRGKSLLCREIIPRIINSREPKDSCGVITAYRLAATGEDVFHRGFLMIDDIGVENDHSSFGTRRNMVREIVDEAEIASTTLILTSNLSLEELKEKYGERTMDRLQSLCRLVVVYGESLRNKKGKRNGLPVRHRAYGIDFNTAEEAEAFKSEQDKLYDSYYNGAYPNYPNDSDEISEHQPLKLYKGRLYSLLKYNWDKVKESL